MAFNFGDKLDSFKGKFDDFIAGKHTGKIISTKKSLGIIVAVVALSLFYIFTFTSSALTEKQFEVSDTVLNKSIELGTYLNINPEKILYSKQQEQINIYLSVDDLYNGYKTDFEISALLRAEKVLRLKSKIVAKQDDVLIISVENVPKEFQAVRIDITPKNIEITTATDGAAVTQKPTTAKIYCTAKNVTTVTKFDETSKKTYLQSAINYKIETVQSDIKALDDELNIIQKKIADNLDTIQKIDERIATLDVQDAASAESAKQKKEAENTSLQKDIETITAKKETLNQRLASLQNRLENIS